MCSEPKMTANLAPGLIAELDQRFQRLRHTLDTAATGGALADWEIELRRLDVAAALGIMAPSGGAQEDAL